MRERLFVLLSALGAMLITAGLLLLMAWLVLSPETMPLPEPVAQGSVQLALTDPTVNQAEAEAERCV